MDCSNNIEVLQHLTLLSRVEALESGNAALRTESAGLCSRLNLNGMNGLKLLISDELSKELKNGQTKNAYTNLYIRTCKHAVNGLQNPVGALYTKGIVFLQSYHI
jgi:hypothetical protein